MSYTKTNKSKQNQQYDIDIFMNGEQLIETLTFNCPSMTYSNTTSSSSVTSTNPTIAKYTPIFHAYACNNKSNSPEFNANFIRHVNNERIQYTALGLYYHVSHKPTWRNDAFLIAMHNKEEDIFEILAHVFEETNIDFKENYKIQ